MTRPTLSLLVLLMALAALGGAPPAQAADETTGAFGDPQHSGAVTDSPLRPPLRQRWRADLGAVVSSVLVAGGRVHYVREPGTGPVLSTLDAGTGRVVWEQRLPGGDAFLGRIGLATDGGRLYVVSNAQDRYPEDLLVRALDAATGAEQWSRTFTADGGKGSDPTAADGQLFVVGAASSGRLHGLRGSDGADLWPPRELGSGDASTPALDAGRIFVTQSGFVFAFDRATGEQRWRYVPPETAPGGGDYAFDPTSVNAGRLYANGLVHDPADGRVIGRYSGRPAFDGPGTGVEWSGDSRGFGPGYDVTRWTSSRSPAPRPVLAGGHAYGAEGGSIDDERGPELYALRASDGAEVWCQPLTPPPGSREGSVATPVAAGSGLLLVSVGYGLAAYESGGTPSSCTDTPAATPGGSAPGGTPGGTPAGPAIDLRVGRVDLRLGQRTNVRGTVRGVPGAAGRRVTLEADAWPFGGRFRTVPGPDARVGADGAFALKLAPRRNVRLRARLVGGEALRSGTVDVYADFPFRLRRIAPGGRRPQLRYTVFAFPKAQIRRKRVYAYLARGRTAAYRRVDARRWQVLGRRSATVRMRYPRGRLVRGDRYLVCLPERTPDAFGRPTEVERRCGARTLPRALVTG